MKTGTILRRIAAFMMAFVLCVTITDTTSFAKETLKPLLSDSKLTMKTNESTYVTLERPSSKVVWKSSNPKLVKIKKVFGKYSMDAVLETGNRTGSCKIKAKMKNKTFSCKVTVKKGDIIKKYSGKKSKTVLEKVTQTKKSVVVRYKMCSADIKCKCPPASYGRVIRLEKYTDGKWREIPMSADLVFPCVLYTIRPKTSVSKAIHLENYYDISKLTKGRYRLYVDVTYRDVKDPYVEFKLK